MKNTRSIASILLIAFALTLTACGKDKKPTKTEPTAAEPAKTEPAKTEPAAAEPKAADDKPKGGW